MQPLLFVRNDPFETFGIAPSAVGGAGADFRVYEAVDGAKRPSLDGFSGIVVFGSSFNVGEAGSRPFINEVAELAREAVGRGMPLLGVCFGAQLLAWALGSKVERAPVREIGFVPVRPSPRAADDPLLAHYRNGDLVFQWHMDTFDLPAGAEILATGDAVANQAFRLGERAWGVQFHFEIDASEIDLWLDEFDREGDLQDDWGTTPQQVRDAVRTHIAGHERAGRDVFGGFVAVAREWSGGSRTRRDTAS
jgi:GMP synthase (glutamine-hydrolysing)